MTDFNIETLRTRVADAIQGSFGSLIPADQFQAMVDKAINDFFHVASPFKIIEREGDDPRDTHSPSWSKRKIKWQEMQGTATQFEIMVWDLMYPLVLDRVQQYFDDNKAELQRKLDEVFTKDVEPGISNLVRDTTVALHETHVAHTVNNALIMVRGELDQALSLNSLKRFR